MDVKRFLPLGGLVAVVLVVCAVVVLGGSTPGNDASGASVASYYESHHAREIVAAFLLAASAPLFVAFGASLAGLLWPTDTSRRRPVWELMLAGGSVLAAAAFLVLGLLTFALADVADELAPGALQALNVLDNDAWVLFNAGLGVMMLGAAGSLLTRESAYRRLGWVALPLGIALFVPIADFFALLLTGAWLVIAGVVLSQRRADSGYSVAPGTA